MICAASVVGAAQGKDRMESSRAIRRGVLAAALALLAVEASACAKKEPQQQAPAPASTSVFVDAPSRTVIVPAVVAVQGSYYDVLKGAIEYVVVSRSGKEYESVFVADCKPQELYDALAQARFSPGRPAGDDSPPRGQPLLISVEYTVAGKTVRRPMDEFVAYLQGGKPLKPRPWTFTGSTKTTDPASDKEVLQATLTNSLIGLHPADPSPLIQNPREEARQANLYTANAAVLPAAGTPVRLIFQRLPATPGYRRVRATISGRVQNVGFDNYVDRCARRLKIDGALRNLPNGRIELCVEGPAQAVAGLLDQVRHGTRHAFIEGVDVVDEPVESEFEGFEIAY